MKQGKEKKAKYGGSELIYTLEIFQCGPTNAMSWRSRHPCPSKHFLPLLSPALALYPHSLSLCPPNKACDIAISLLHIPIHTKSQPPPLQSHHRPNNKKNTTEEKHHTLNIESWPFNLRVTRVVLYYLP